MAPQFHKLKIRDIRRETAQAVSIAFEVPAGLRESYAFRPGQYLTLRTTLGGEDIRRSYSICVPPSAGDLRIAVKRASGGAFSGFANGALKPGDSLDVMTPQGRFTLAEHAGGRVVLAVAAGSGITPLISIMSSVLETEPHSRVLLIYGNRRMDDILFRTQLDNLKDKHMGRFSVQHVLSGEERDSPLLTGRIDAEKIKRIVSGVLGDARIDAAMICGPAALSETARAALAEIGVTGEALRSEYFAPPKTQARRLGEKPAASGATVPNDSRALKLVFAGRAHNLAIAPDESIVEAAQRAGLEVPFACKGGMCCTCRARLVQGEARMELNYSLEKWEMEAGFILTCQARVTSQTATVDYDAL